MTVLLTRRAALLGSATIFASAAAPRADISPEPRRILALYDGAIETQLKETSVHALAAMPIEWLGLILEYHDVRRGLPPIWNDPSYRGVLTWFPEPNLADYAGYVAWIERIAGSGLRIVQVGDAAPKPGSVPAAVESTLRRRMFAALGVRASGLWSAVTLGDRVVSKALGSVEFEHRFDAVLPAYELYTPAREDASSWLVIERADRVRSQSHVIIVSPRSGFIAPGYAVAPDPETGVKQWFVNPFAFFAEAFATGDLPAPDTTTLCGRRIYYSHIDGDGWRSVSQVRALGRAPATNAEIVLQSAIAANPDLPVTVAPIAAEMDPAFAGDLRAIAAARALFRLDHVEPATHTYTHPFRWNFFEHYTPETETPFQDAYRQTMSGHAAVVETSGTVPGPGSCCGHGTRTGPSPPRAFGGRAFDLNEEIVGSARLIDAIAGASGKRVALLQWPGDCTPFPDALRAVAGAGLLNINGGDTRCDSEFPSVSAVAPLGFQRDGTVQVYASNSSEELYTDLWTGRYFGFRDLPQTWDRTEAPRRLKPLNLYYHMYSGERRSSLDALLANIDALRQRGDYIGVFASRFAALAEGFFSAACSREGASAWRIKGRGGLQTFRFAQGARRMLDVRASDGVLGERLVNGDLYVALDPANSAPLIVLTARANVPPQRPALVQSAWEISHLDAGPDRASFEAKGFGPGTMEWHVPAAGTWRVRTPGQTTRTMVGTDHRLLVELPSAAIAGISVTIEREA